MIQAARRKYYWLLLSLLLPCVGEAQESRNCATTIGGLRALLADASFPLDWQETTMDDGKPMMVAIREANDVLVLEFVKTNEGLWAASPGEICRNGVDLETRLIGDGIRLGPAAGWLFRSALAGGGKFTLTPLGARRLRIATSGWSGTFSPRTK